MSEKPKMSVRTRQIHDRNYADLWAELWLRPGAPREVIDAAYRALSRKYHPDTGVNDPMAQQRLNVAYKKLIKE